MMQVECIYFKRELWTKADMEIQADAESYADTQKFVLDFPFSPISDSGTAILFNLLNHSGPTEGSRFTFLDPMSTSHSY